MKLDELRARYSSLAASSSDERTQSDWHVRIAWTAHLLECPKCQRWSIGAIREPTRVWPCSIGLILSSAIGILYVAPDALRTERDTYILVEAPDIGLWRGMEREAYVTPKDRVGRFLHDPRSATASLARAAYVDQRKLGVRGALCHRCGHDHLGYPGCGQLIRHASGVGCQCGITNSSTPRASDKERVLADRGRTEPDDRPKKPDAIKPESPKTVEPDHDDYSFGYDWGSVKKL